MSPRLLCVCLLPGYAFLYLPIALMAVFSFNETKMLTVWTGFSLRWYAALWNDPALIAAALLSLRIAAISATLATILGTAAGYTLARFPRFRGRSGFAALLTIPLVLPDVIAGIALLLLFVTLQRLIGLPTERGTTTIAIAHTTIALAYVAIIVRARLTDAGTELEDAAADLGARPVTVFIRITLPLIAPALISGWLLAFTLSLDDLVVASFVSGPGATTLPMVLFSSAKRGVGPEFFALATIVMAIVLLALLAAWLIPRLNPVAPRPGGG